VLIIHPEVAEATDALVAVRDRCADNHNTNYSSSNYMNEWHILTCKDGHTPHENHSSKRQLKLSWTTMVGINPKPTLFQ